MPRHEARGGGRGDAGVMTVCSLRRGKKTETTAGQRRKINNNR